MRSVTMETVFGRRCADRASAWRHPAASPVCVGANRMRRYRLLPAAANGEIKKRIRPVRTATGRIFCFAGGHGSAATGKRTLEQGVRFCFIGFRCPVSFRCPAGVRCSVGSPSLRWLCPGGGGKPACGRENLPRMPKKQKYHLKKLCVFGNIELYEKHAGKLLRQKARTGVGHGVLERRSLK